MFSPSVPQASAICGGNKPQRLRAAGSQEEWAESWRAGEPEQAAGGRNSGITAAAVTAAAVAAGSRVGGFGGSRDLIADRRHAEQPGHVDRRVGQCRVRHRLGQCLELLGPAVAASVHVLL